jgi:hypothetical protein
LVSQLLFYALALAGWIVAERHELPFVLSVPLYFCIVNLACLKGILDAYLGRSYTTWTTARTDET